MLLWRDLFYVKFFEFYGLSVEILLLFEYGQFFLELF